MYVCILLFMYIHIHILLHIHIHMHMHINIHIYIYTHTYIYIYINIHTLCIICTYSVIFWVHISGMLFFFWDDCDGTTVLHRRDFWCCCTPGSAWDGFASETLVSTCQWICLRENLQENHMSYRKIYGFPVNFPLNQFMGKNWQFDHSISLMTFCLWGN